MIKQGLSPFVATCMVLGFIFLYAPILLMILYSFNESRLVTVWAGFSIKWYVSLFSNTQVLSAAWLSIEIAFITAVLSVILGTMAAVVLVRFGKFRGRTAFTGMIAAPLVMPDVIQGLSLLLLFVLIQQLFGWPARGALTIIIANTSFCASYAAVVIQSRLASMDRSFEEAARDLGASPRQTFFSITLPLIRPSLIAGWLLSFILAFDNLVIASFVTGPSATTLPMVIFSKVRLGVSPDINALATIIIVFVSIGVIVAGLILQKQAADRLKVQGAAG